MIYAEVVRCFDALHWTRSFLRVEFVDKNSVFFGWAAVRLSKSLRFNWSNFQRFLFWFDAHNILNIQSVGIPQKSHIWPTHLRHLTMFITASQSKMDWIHQPDRVDLSLGTRDSQYVTLVKNAYFVIADSLGCKWSVAPAFFFFRSLQRASSAFLVCSNFLIFDDALWILHVFQLMIEARYEPPEAWRFIIAPIFSFHSNYKLTQKIVEFLWLYLFYFSVFLLGF